MGRAMPVGPMFEASCQLPQHVLEALDAVEDVSLGATTPSTCAVAGMGGSSIGGALAARQLERQAPSPIAVVRDHEVPGFVDEDTFVVATSYSGSTQETIDAARDAVDRGARIAAVTTGGELGELVREAGGPVVEPPSGYEPRAAVGWLFAANYALLADALDVGAPDELAAAAKRLEDRLDALVDQGGVADELAAGLGEGAVGVVGHGVMGTVARRWAAELSENAERLAFHSVLPEAAHNQIVGWAGTPGDATLVVLRRAGETPAARTRLDVLTRRAAAAGATVLDAQVDGSGLAGLLEGVLLGDLVSLHLARREDVDPEPVEAIDALKAALDELDE